MQRLLSPWGMLLRPQTKHADLHPNLIKSCDLGQVILLQSVRVVKWSKQKLPFFAKEDANKIIAFRCSFCSVIDQH